MTLVAEVASVSKIAQFYIDFARMCLPLLAWLIIPLPTLDQNILQFNRPMHNVSPMKVPECFKKLPRNFLNFFLCHGRLAITLLRRDVLPQVTMLAVALHYLVIVLLILQNLTNFKNIWVLKLVRESYFILKLLQQMPASVERALTDNFHGIGTPCVAIRHLIHTTMITLAQRLA